MKNRILIGNNIKLLQLVFACFTIAFQAVAEDATSGKSGLTECQARGGLPNFFAKLEAGGDVRIAYLGGSITEAEGWRVLSRQWFATNYPTARVSEIRATMSGTGAEFGACRLDDHVLKHDPDLVFIEFAVNGTGDSQKRSIRSVEGIVRHIWQHDPRTDICFVFTISDWFLKGIQGGQEPQVMRLMDKVAEHYQIPSIQLGLEVARLEAAGRLIFKGHKPETDAEKQALGDKIVFSPDGVHPFTDVGHPFYLAAIVRSVPALKAAGAANHAGVREIPAPLDSENWEKAQLVSLGEIQKTAGWKKVTPPGTTEGWQRISQYLPGVWCATQPGETLTFSFRGTCLGLAGFREPDAGQFAVTVDDGPPVKAAFFDHDTYASNIILWPWFYPRDLTNGLHHVTVELLAESLDKAAVFREKGQKLNHPEQYAGNVLNIGAVLIAGELITPKRTAKNSTVKTATPFN